MSNDDTFAVLWVYQQVKSHGVPVEAGQKPSLCFKGRKHMICVVAGHPVRVIKRPASDFPKLRKVMYTQENGTKAEYPISKAVETFTGIGERSGITRGAQELLARAIGIADPNLDEDSFKDEEEVAGTEDPLLEGPSEPAAPKVKAPPREKKEPSSPRGPSKIGQALEFMTAEIQASNGAAKQLPWRKALFERTAEKFGISVMTCSIQYGKKIKPALGIK